MAQRFRRDVHAGRASIRYSRRSRRGGRRKTEVKCIDTSMVRSKEDFMNIIGLDMKTREEEEETKNEDATIKKDSYSSAASLMIRECSVVITGENCKICGLLFKSISDVIFHMEMRHGDGFRVCGKFVEATIGEAKEKSCASRKRRSIGSNDNNNRLRVKLKIGDEIISEISINRKHLKIHAPAAKATEASRRRENDDKESSVLKNHYKSSIVGIDSFVSSKNHCDDYVMNVQPLNRTHQQAPRNPPLLLHESQYDANSNYVLDTRRIEDSNSTDEHLLLGRLRWWPLHRTDIICNNNNNNSNSNNNHSNINISSISESNTSDKENESKKTQPVKNFTTNSPPCQLISDDDDIQEVLRITRRRPINNNANINHDLVYSVYGKTTFSNSEEEFESRRKIHWPNYSSHEILA